MAETPDERTRPASGQPGAGTGSLDSHVPTPGLAGWITHTDISSADPAATRAWCEAVLGWNFHATIPVPQGEYHLFAFSETGGGGIGGTRPGERPGSTPFVHVPDTGQAFEAAIRAGAEEVEPVTRVMEGVTTAVVRAPGGVVIGFSGP
jgi:uncharacterized protein